MEFDWSDMEMPGMTPEQTMNYGASMQNYGDRAADARRMAVAVVAIVGDDAGEAEAREAVTLAGGRLAAAVRFEGAADRLAMQAAADIILIDAMRVSATLLDSAIAAASHLAEETQARIVICFDETRIDAVAAQLFGPDVQLLCNPGRSELVAALALAGRSGTLAVNDITRESESDRLRRLNDEVARIAETLARLTQRDDAGGMNGVVKDRAPAYGAPPPEARAIPVDAATVRRTIRARRLRDQVFDAGLFADPAWDMLLDLYAAKLEHARVSVSSLCIAAAVPPTTALRWITSMTEAGLFERQADPLDRRRVYIGLSEEACGAMNRYWTDIGKTGLITV